MREAGAGEGDARSEGQLLSLRLYIAGHAPNSVEAQANLTVMLQKHQRDRYRLEVVDFLREPQRALNDGVVVTPTLVKLSPPPVSRIIGTLRELPKVMAALGIVEASRV